MATNILPGGSSGELRQLLTHARHISSDIRHQRSDIGSGKAKRGPVATKFRLKYYLLPESSVIPKLSGRKDDALVDAHHQCGYGYPQGNKTKKHSCSLQLTKGQYDAFLASLYNRPEGTRFLVYKSDRKRNLNLVYNISDMKKYSGIVFLKIDDGTIRNNPNEINNSSDDDSLIDFDVSDFNARVPLPPSQQNVNDDLPLAPQNMSAESRTAEDLNTESRSQQGAGSESLPRRNQSVESTLEQNTNIDLPLRTPQNNTVTQASARGSSDISTPRPYIIYDEEIQFAANQIDPDRAQRRREARERLSLRAIQHRQRAIEAAAEAEQQRVHVIERMGEEPEDSSSILLTFRCPEPAVALSRRFHITDPCELIHRYAQASIGQQCVINVPQGEPLPNDNSTLQDNGVTSNICLNIDFENPSTTTAQTEAEEAFLDAPTSPGPLPEDTEPLADRAERLRDGLLPSKTVSVKRDELVDNLLDAYRANEGLEHHDVFMIIDNEPAIDFDGVKREVFSMFFTLVFMRCFTGNSQCVPTMNPDFLCSDFFFVLGKIISHAYVLVGYFPVRLSLAALVSMLTGKCSEKVTMTSFVDFLSGRQQKVVIKVNEEKKLDLEGKMILWELLTKFGMSRSPKEYEFKECLKNIAKLATVLIPLGALGKMCQGMRVYPGLWERVSEQQLKEMYKVMTPQTVDVLNKITYEFSENTVLRSAEERVKEYLETMIRDEIGDDGLPQLLQFWTASNTVVVSEFKVIFNSDDSAGRRPSSHACLSQLELSRFFVSYEEFVQEFLTYLNSEQAKEFDTI